MVTSLEVVILFAADSRHLMRLCTSFDSDHRLCSGSDSDFSVDFIRLPYVFLQLPNRRCGVDPFEAICGDPSPRSIEDPIVRGHQVRDRVLPRKRLSQTGLPSL